jgi:hypothetical protein
MLIQEVGVDMAAKCSLWVSHNTMTIAEENLQ